MSFRLTEAEDRDIARILTDTLELFGPIQLKTYASLIERGLELIGDDPSALGTIERGDIAPGVRMLHLQNVARRRGAASHGVYYLPSNDEAGAVSVVLHVLHDRMEPSSRVARSLASDDDPK